MKQAITLLIFTSISCTLFAEHAASITLEPLWQKLDKKNTNQDKFGGQWILVGSITFRNKSKEIAKLDRIKLHWHGEKIDRLCASLYKKLPDKKFYPIQDNLLCDSCWNKSQQYLTLDFSDRRQTLGPINIFYLVLTVPEDVEQKLKTGHFSLTKSHLPAPFMRENEAQKNSELKLNIAQYMQASGKFKA